MEITETNIKLKIIQFMKFVCFSLGAGVIEFLTFSLVVLLIGNNDKLIIIAEVLSVVLSCLFNFTLNRKYTFKSTDNIIKGMILYGLFYLIITPLGTLFILKLVHMGIPELIAKPIKMITFFILDFSFCKFVLFKH